MNLNSIEGFQIKHPLIKKHYGLIIFVVVLGVYLLSLNGVWATDHTSSFVQLDWSIWVDHAFNVNDSQTAGNPVYSMDDFPLNSTWYIASAPGLSFFSLPFVIVGFLLDGYSPFGQVLTFSEAFVALMGALTAYLVYRVARMFFQEKTSIFLAFAVGFSTLLWPFATYYFPHDLSAMFVMLTTFLALKITRDRGSDSRLSMYLFCGLAVGCALLVDYIDALLIPTVSVYLLYKTKRSAGLLNFLCGAAVGIAAVAAYNLAAFGRILTTSQNLYDGKPFLSDFSTPILQGLFWNFISPYRGLFWYCPLIILAPAGFYLMFKYSKDKSQVILFLAIMLSIVIPYSMWQDVTAGVSFGPRFLIPAIPFLILPVGQLFERGRSEKDLAYLLYGIGVVLNGSAALVSVIHPNFSTVPSWTTEIFGTMLSSLSSGSLDVWWLSYLGQYWWVLAFSLVACPIVTLFAIDRVMSGDEEVKSKAKHAEIVAVPIAKTKA